VICAIFYGTDNYFASSDAYIINAQGRFKLTLDPPPLTSGHTITVYYIQRPNPVYSPYRSYRIPIGYKDPLVMYAAWKYKYRDREPNYGDALYKYWDASVRAVGSELNSAMRKKGYRVNLVKRASRSGSYK
jgi:hypothetical protein